MKTTNKSAVIIKNITTKQQIDFIYALQKAYKVGNPGGDYLTEQVLSESAYLCLAKESVDCACPPFYVTKGCTHFVRQDQKIPENKILILDINSAIFAADLVDWLESEYKAFHTYDLENGNEVKIDFGNDIVIFPGRLEVRFEDIIGITEKINELQG